MEENKNPEQEEVEIVETSIDGLKISNDAVATYAGIAISEVQGVYGMSGGFAGITEAISGKKNFSKGIKVEVTEKSAKIDVSVSINTEAASLCSISFPELP